MVWAGGAQTPQRPPTRKSWHLLICQNRSLRNQGGLRYSNYIKILVASFFLSFIPAWTLEEPRGADEVEEEMELGGR